MRARFFVIIGIVVFVSVIAGSGYVLYVVKKAPDQTGQPTQATAETSATATTPEQDRDMERYADATAMKLALGSYFARKSAYPATLAELVPSDLPEIPTDPSSSAPYPYELVEDAYRISFILEKGALGLSAGDHTLTPNGFDVAPSRPVTAVAETRPPATIPGTGTAPSPISEPTPSPLPTENSADTDQDGLSNDAEVRTFFTDPSKPDSDDDGMDDMTELRNGRDPSKTGAMLPDADGDRLPDSYEFYLGLRADAADTDSDGMTDDFEILIYGTDPTLADTDRDGFVDGAEAADGYDPLGEGKFSEEQLAEIEGRKKAYSR